MEAKDFQKATADRIVDLFNSGHKRVLLADEVGLGKTIVARTVVEKVGTIQQNNNKDFVVVYICSNAGIANQNCSKLGVPSENSVNISDGRLSMQHLLLAELKNEGSTRLIPMTPATSFQIKSGAGTAPERALAYYLLSYSGVCGYYDNELSILMRTSLIRSDSSWREYVDRQKNRIERLDDKKSYLNNMKTKIRQWAQKEENDNLIEIIKSNCQKISFDLARYQKTGDISDIVSWQDQKSIINHIRYCFAQISLDMLNPNLVIMDEFQRFRDLIEIEDDDKSDSAMLSRRFLKENNDSLVLLLSATPYKPYSTLSEYTNGEETHLQGFMRLMNFLSASENDNRKFRKVWENYSKHLSEIRGNEFSILIAAKKDAESELYNLMCRTERRDSAIINTDKAKYMSIEDISEANIKSYIELQNTMNCFNLGSFPVDYVKSAPYLMSFMNYQVKDKIDNGMGDLKDCADVLKKMSTAFLKRSLINDYQELPDTNARLKTLFKEVFRPDNNERIFPELLLWIPPANKYYKCGNDNIFEQCNGYSKTLVFSCWEMVPRVISTITSYESERLVNKRIINKSVEQQSYYALPEADEMDDGEKTTKSKRGKVRFLIREQRELVSYPSIWLSKLYDSKKYYGQELEFIKKKIKTIIINQINVLKDKYNLSDGHYGAKQFLNFLQFMDSKKIFFNRYATVPEKVPCAEDIDVLVNIAIGSPAVCLYRSLTEIYDKKTRREMAGKCCDESFVSMFNRPESRSIMAAIYGITSGDERHYEQVFHYCVDGNFQAMLDEYKFTLGLNGEEFIDAVKNAFLQTANLPYVSQEYYKSCFNEKPQKNKPRLRVHFAAGYFDAKVNDKTIQRVNNVRNAFNSPFRPFVLATTSIGQEGLDFHLYCRKIVHWNLPANPIDLEQREGRINRYMCHAIRQNIAVNEEEFEWEEKINSTKKKYGSDASDMIPYWCLPDDYPFKYYIERIVPMYPFSKDKTKYDRLKNVLAMYRLTLGQPRQEEMISILQRKDLSKEQMKELFFDLSPYSRNHKTKK